MVDSDLRDFENASAQQDWACAVAAYRSVFCEGFEHKAAEPFVEWIRFERHRLAAAYRAAVAQRLVQLGDEVAARESLARQWLGFDPFDEDALAALADALRAQGQSGEARRAIDEFAQRLERELAVEPSARVRALASGDNRCAWRGRVPMRAPSPSLSATWPQWRRRWGTTSVHAS
jgi:DNA-binding SARP family transcriptional activator